MSKILRRRILIETLSPSTVRADLEDNQHRFGVTVSHDGSQVIEVAADSRHMRHPWAQCPGATARLPRLIGMALTSHPQGAYTHTPGAEQCTHLFDLANLAIAHAARGTPQRRYDAVVECTTFSAQKTDRGFTLHGHRHLQLFRDDQQVLDWPMEGDDITAGPHGGQNVRRMMAWVDTNVRDRDELEAIAVARRALIVSTSLLFDMDNLPPGLPQRASSRAGACYAYQPGVMETLTRAHGNSRDFADRPEALLADLKTR